MPTPFMHMALAQRLSRDPDLPPSARSLLMPAWGAFLLGSIAPDARLSSGMERADTHFFRYGAAIDPPAVTAMLRRYSSLRREAITDDIRAAFVAGYAAHLAMDETWCVRLLFPYFMLEALPDRMWLFHKLVGYLDRRDRAQIPADYYLLLKNTAPQGWLPFIDDAALIAWQSKVAEQLAPGGESQTMAILGRALGIKAADLAAAIDDEAQMQTVWSHISPETVAHIEAGMYSRVRETLTAYLSNHTG
jgi:hypothetical protein